MCLMPITNSRSVPFTSLPDESRLWIFASPAPLAPEAEAALLDRVDQFLEEWHAHGRPVVGGRDLRYNQFLFVAADEAATGVSGCSTDSMFRTVKEAERDLGITLVDSARVWYRQGEDVRSTTRPEFRELVKSGEVGPDTIVFDNTAPTVGDVRAGRWERPMAESWHGKAFLR